MRRVFLSHSSADKDFVRIIADKLGDIAIIDERDFAAGGLTMDEIKEKIHDASIFVVFLSSLALESQWVLKELDMAIDNALTHGMKIIIFSIEKNIKYTDKRIPAQLRKSYNIQYVKSPELAVSRIRDEYRKLSILDSPVQKETENLFIGRAEQIKKFEADFSDIDGHIPTFLIAVNYYDGMGRTHFIKHGLNRINLLKLTQSPLVISLQRGESVENFIIKMNSYLYNEKALNADLSKLSIDAKRQLALDLVKDYKRNNRIIFIKDEGAIVLPNHKLVEWFDWLVQAEELCNRLTFCLVSTWTPSSQFLYKNNLGVAYHIGELDVEDTKNLFINLLKIYGIHQISPKQKKEFLPNLTGIPSQILFTIQQIRTLGVERALLSVEEIKIHTDSYSANLLDSVRSNSLAYQICLILANSIVSLDVLIDVFGDSDDVKSAMIFLKDYSILDFIDGNITSVRINPTLSDYIRRRKLTPDSDVQNKLNDVIKSYVAVSLEELALDDYSKLLLVIEDCMNKGQEIPSKYYIAPLLISNIFKEYNAGNYKKVEIYCINLLRQKNIDSQVQWELQYHLVRVYARTGQDEFWPALRNSKLDYVDREFLTGFYYRNKKNPDDIKSALCNFMNVLNHVPDHRRARREIVNTYLLLEDYQNALRYAKDNYEQNPGDILHLHSYFTSLIRRKDLDLSTEYNILKDLIDKAGRNKDARAADILRCMQGEFSYYVERNFTKSIRILNEAKNINENRRYPLKALLDIYRAEGMFEYAEEIKKELSEL